MSDSFFLWSFFQNFQELKNKKAKESGIGFFFGGDFNEFFFATSNCWQTYFNFSILHKLKKNKKTIRINHRFFLSFFLEFNKFFFVIRQSEIILVSGIELYFDGFKFENEEFMT